ncbi:Tl family protein [Megaselia abdita]
MLQRLILLCLVQLSISFEIKPFLESCDFYKEIIIQCSNIGELKDLQDVKETLSVQEEVIKELNKDEKHKLEFLNKYLESCAILKKSILCSNIIEKPKILEAPKSTSCDVNDSNQLICQDFNSNEKSLGILHSNQSDIIFRNSKIQELNKQFMKYFPKANTYTFENSELTFLEPSEVETSGINDESFVEKVEFQSCTLKNLQNFGYSFASSHLKKISFDNTSFEDREIPTEMFSHCQGVQEIKINKCDINDVEEGAFDRLVGLRKLTLQDNPIESLPKDLFKENKELKELKIISCSLHELSVDLPHSLEELTIAKNVIPSIQAESFEHLSRLEHLSLDENSIKTVEYGSFHHMPKIRTIQLRNNKLTQIKAGQFSNLTNLLKLNFQGNEIRTVDPKAFWNVSSLFELDLSRNNLKGIAFQSIVKSLRTLDLSANEIADVAKIENVHNIEDLENLNLALNSISLLGRRSFAGFRSLKILTLTGNKISQMNENAFPLAGNIQHLYLDKNNLTVIHKNLFRRQKELRGLSLADNNIDYLDDGIFRNCRKLRVLNLQNNKIKSLSKKHFEGMVELETVDMRGNHIQNFDKNWLYNVTVLDY